ncbi:hypothetical protein ACJMK2_003230 [Sinanodonta woodiana]|uniref:BTB domain-containing protein n=1 Tax=Sinanodonta woodiana TaxID=1069815 RepID=A0ABD3XXR7_SINWO
MKFINSMYLISQYVKPDLTADLFKKTELTDITLIVEGKELHFAKYPLIAGSTVFANMIKKENSRLVLHGVRYIDMIVFLKCLHPKTLEVITDSNLEHVARIAHRFKQERILHRCEEYILEKFNQDEMYPDFLFYLKVADQCKMNEVIQVGVSSERVKKAFFSRYSYEFPYTGGYENNEDFKELSADTKVQILSSRLRFMEKETTSDSYEETYIVSG